MRQVEKGWSWDVTLIRIFTPPKFNIAPEQWWLEDENPFGIAYFWKGLEKNPSLPLCQKKMRFYVETWHTVEVKHKLITRWWFQIFFLFTTIWGRFPIWLIFFRWVETTDQISILDFSLNLIFTVQSTESLIFFKISSCIYCHFQLWVTGGVFLKIAVQYRNYMLFSSPISTWNFQKFWSWHPPDTGKPRGRPLRLGICMKGLIITHRIHGTGIFT